MHPIRPASFGGVRLQRYPHACAVVDGPEQEAQVVAPFVREGLEDTEQVVFIHGPERREAVLEGLGPEAAAAADEGQLVMLGWEDAYLRGGRFEVDRMLELVEETAALSRRRGYTRVRLVGHMDWTVSSSETAADAIEYEARVNAVLARSGTPAVCVYPIDRVPARMLVELLAVHPVVFLNGQAQVSPFFVAPDVFLQARPGVAF